MDSKEINELLSRYWDCETSLSEEQQLRDYFNTDNVPTELKETAVLFRYFEESKKKSLQEILRRVDLRHDHPRRAHVQGAFNPNFIVVG